MAALLLLLGWLGAEPLVVTDRVDLLEVNHFYDANGEPVFTQFIWWDYNRAENRYDVRAWKLDKGEPQQGGTVTWWDGGVRRVVAGQRRETFTQFDPELTAREVLSTDRRRGLTPHKGR